MNNALFLFLSCGLIGVVSTFIYSGLKRQGRRESSDTPPRSRVVSKSSSQAIRQARAFPSVINNTALPNLAHRPNPATRPS